MHGSGLHLWAYAIKLNVLDLLQQLPRFWHYSNWHWPIESLWQNGQLVGDANYLFTLSFAWWIVATYLVWRYPAMAKAWNEGIVMRAIAGFLTLVPLWLALNTLVAQVMANLLTLVQC